MTSFTLRRIRKDENWRKPTTHVVWTRRKTWPDSTAKALELSIQKWQNIVAGLEADELAIVECGAGETCALCRWTETHSLRAWSCYGCPVRMKTGESGCIKTPWQDFEKAQRTGNHGAQLKAARAELKFLISLRKLASDLDKGDAE